MQNNYLHKLDLSVVVGSLTLNDPELVRTAFTKQLNFFSSNLNPYEKPFTKFKRLLRQVESQEIHLISMDFFVGELIKIGNIAVLNRNLKPVRLFEVIVGN